MRTEPVDDVAGTDAWWAAALAGESVLLRHDSNGRACPPLRGEYALGTVSRCALRPAGDVEAVLLVTGRTFEEETFGQEDLRVFETLAAHAAVALDKARVVDRLRRLADERAHDALHDPLTGLPEPARVQRRRRGRDAPAVRPPRCCCWTSTTSRTSTTPSGTAPVTAC